MTRFAGLLPPELSITRLFEVEARAVLKNLASGLLGHRAGLRREVEDILQSIERFITSPRYRQVRQ